MKTATRLTVGHFGRECGGARLWRGAVGCVALSFVSCDADKPTEAPAPAVTVAAPVGVLRAPIVSSTVIEVAGDTFVRPGRRGNELRRRGLVQWCRGV